MTGTDPRWYTGDLVALELEGTGAQDRDQEAILEIAVVPLTDGHPAPGRAWHSLVNPGRPVPARPWISPGLTTEALRHTPTVDQLGGELTGRLHGRWLVGHNVGVDARLLRLRCPDIAPAGLIDTLALARTARVSTDHSTCPTPHRRRRSAS